MYNICIWFILFHIHLYTKEYIQGGNTSVQRHPLPFRCIHFYSEAALPIEGIHLRRSRSMFLLVSTSRSPSYFALGCSKLLACEYSAEHGVTFDPDCRSCRNVHRRLVYQKLEPASVYDFWVYLPNNSPWRCGWLGWRSAGRWRWRRLWSYI